MTDNGLVMARTAAELRRAAARGCAYYSCERYEDPFGRLVVGVGAKLDGRVLSFVARRGRRAYSVSQSPLSDREVATALRSVTEGNPGLQRALPNPTPGAGAWDATSAPARKTVGEALRRIQGVCPDAVGLVQAAGPLPVDLVHAARVARYAERLVTAFDACRDDGAIVSPYPYSERVREIVYLAGFLHDIGRWGGSEAAGHTARGALMLESRAAQSGALGSVAGIVGQHHMPMSELDGRPWRMHKTAPVAMAEGIVEGSGPAAAVVRRLGEGRMSASVRALWVCLCNLEGALPPGSIARSGGSGGSERTVPFDLAVSLHTPALEHEERAPVLLRFARVGAEGRAEPLLPQGTGPAAAAELLVRPGRVEGDGWQVVGLLPREVYARKFADYESLVPRYRRAAAKDPDRLAAA